VISYGGSSNKSVKLELESTPVSTPVSDVPELPSTQPPPRSEDLLLSMTTDVLRKKSTTNVHVAPLTVLATPVFIGRVVAFTRTTRVRTHHEPTAKQRNSIQRRRAYASHFRSNASMAGKLESAPLSRETSDTEFGGLHSGQPSPSPHSPDTTDESFARPQHTTSSDDDAMPDSAAPAPTANEPIAEVVNAVKEGDTLITEATFELTSDAFLSPQHRLLFYRPGQTVTVLGNGHTMYLGRFGCPDVAVPTPDIVAWNIIVGSDTTVVLRDVTVVVDESWRGLLHMSRSGRFTAHRANGVYIEVIRLADEQFEQDSDTGSDLGASLNNSSFSFQGQLDDDDVNDG